MATGIPPIGRDRYHRSMADQSDVRRMALSLPETSEDPQGFAVRVNGKAFAWEWMERVDPKRARVPNSDVLAVRVENELEKQSLLALDTDVFFTEAHYNGHPAVLVRLPAIDLDLLEKLLADAWRTKAPRRLLSAFEGSPSQG
jgi:hypothetical protein